MALETCFLEYCLSDVVMPHKLSGDESETSLYDTNVSDTESDPSNTSQRDENWNLIADDDVLTLVLVFHSS